MKILCNRTDLLKGVNIVMKAVPSKTTLTILQCILIDATTNTIKFTANDMELGIETVVEGEIMEHGMIALDARMFSEMIRKLPDNEVLIDTDENLQTTIVCEKSRFNISGKDGDEFSFLPYVEKEHHITISQYTLKEAIRQTIFSIADSEANRMMGGVLFHIEGDLLRVVSLDGHRISIRRIRLKEEYPGRKVVVPGKTLIEISKILAGDTESDVNIYFTENHIVFEFEQTVVLSRLIEGEYFRVEQMISNDYETKVKVNKKELLNCIDRSTLFIREDDKKPIIIHIKDGLMELMIRSEFGSMDEEIEDEKEGKDIMIGFNPKFLIDALRVIDDEDIFLYLTNAKAPCFIRDDEKTYIYLILPVNFNVPE